MQSFSNSQHVRYAVRVNFAFMYLSGKQVRYICTKSSSSWTTLLAALLISFSLPSCLPFFSSADAPKHLLNSISKMFFSPLLHKALIFPETTQESFYFVSVTKIPDPPQVCSLVFQPTQKVKTTVEQTSFKLHWLFAFLLLNNLLQMCIQLQDKYSTS